MGRLSAAHCSNLISHNLSGLMSWSASNSSLPLARAMDPEPAALNNVPHPRSLPHVNTSAAFTGIVLANGLSPSSDDAFGPDNQGSNSSGSQGGRQSSITSPATSTSPSSGSVSGSRPEQSQSQAQAQDQDQAQAQAQAQAQQTQQAKEKERATVPSACVQCRSKHLKCDGLQPCSRCSSNSFECEYVRSRRGFKGPRRNGTHNKASAISAHSAGPVDMSCPLVHPNGLRGLSNAANGLVMPADDRLITLPRSVNLPLFDIGQEVVAFDPKTLPSGLDMKERCIEAFFFHFYPAHPFTLPRSNHFALRKERPIECLEAAMCYVGSFYVPQAPTKALGLEAERSVYHTDCPRDGFRVQAMLILTIGLDGYTFQEKALQILLDAQDLALEIGMNKRDFASVRGFFSDILQESWRRTWWELYITDGMIAGVHQKSNFRMKEIPADVLLPCEEIEYVSGQIPHPHSIQDFDDESFDGRDFFYSSYTYRIAAIRNLGRVLQSRQILPSDEQTMSRADAYLVNWRLHLPDAKKTLISHDGRLDEMLFQAHMITEATTILLHREASELDSSAARDVTSCAPHMAVVPGPTHNIHAAKTIQAAQEISKLIQLPVPLIKHTHFFTCVVTLASIVHLSCWSILVPLMRDDDLKQQLRLSTGALKTLCQVWPAAGKAFGQVKGVAQEIYTAKKQAAEVGYWSNLTQDEVMRSIIEDQSIMEDLHLLN
ncbi:related to Zn(II)2Cys6 transcriptional activator [Rhynchosporium agropyri]|uniref:Related to Zn(II)2Cys6 transcriptional activator n=1 Tax=Rhynchosporium agropyri TaxID=914238 RepID=A0A1E1K3D6_9HELO|nr:related to Zn(II)2Cys6 transcriptional activator [Rhynchosporium agropyri]